MHAASWAPAPSGAIKAEKRRPAAPDGAFNVTQPPALMACLRNPWREPRRRQLDDGSEQEQPDAE